MEPNITLTPTRRLSTKERAVFDRVVSEFNHLAPSDEEMLSQWSEAVVRYQIAARSTKKNPTITLPVVNRATGNVTGEKTTRNPAFATLKEATLQMNSLARRLMIDAHSAEKRLRLQSKKARSAASVVANNVANAALNITKEQIQEKMNELAKVYTAASPEMLRVNALWYLVECREGRFSDEDDDLNLYTVPTQ